MKNKNFVLSGMILVSLFVAGCARNIAGSHSATMTPLVPANPTASIPTQVTFNVAQVAANTVNITVTGAGFNATVFGNFVNGDRIENAQMNIMSYTPSMGINPTTTTGGVGMQPIPCSGPYVAQMVQVTHTTPPRFIGTFSNPTAGTANTVNPYSAYCPSTITFN